MAASIQGDIVYLIGGVNLHCDVGATSPIIVLDLGKRSWVECVPQVGIYPWLCPVMNHTLTCVYVQFIGVPALLHGHTCHCIGQSVLILGGGGNCFSFGTVMNSTMLSFKCAP